MDDSDQDFSVLCSRLLKRVRRKGESGDDKTVAAKDEESDSHVQNTAADVVSSKRKAPSKRKRHNDQNDRPLHAKVTGKTQPDRLTNRSSQLTMDVAVSTDAEGAGSSSVGEVKEKVLRRMKRFKRASPPRLLHNETPPHPPPGPLDQPESDELVALRLQEQLDRAAQAEVHVEEGGLFFCQLCHKDLSAMSPRLRTQHINRCLDKSENASGVLHPAPLPPPSRPRLPECPICGRGFKSEKSRSVHLKRCAASMGVSPAELLHALQRQAAESLSDSAAIQLQQAGGNRMAEASGLPVRKKTRRKAPCMDEDTMVALALSRSLLEQEKERERDREEERQIQAQLSSSPAAVAAPPPPVLKWRPAAGTRRGKRRKSVPASPPPLLLVQDPQTACRRIQERISSLLLHPRTPTPPTPTLPPSKLPTRAHSTPIWLKSALPGGGPDSLCEFYIPELGAFIQPWIGSEKKPPVCSEKTPQKQRPVPTTSQPASTPLSLDQRAAERHSTPASLTPDLGMPGTQALRDLVELAEEGMTLTQCTCPDPEAAVAELPPSGFVPETAETTAPSTNTVTVSRLCSDLGSMVNNPQLSDVQLQVDSGEVYFAHSFMLYTRCPLLVNMVHNAGFGVREEDLPHAHRVLLGDVPGEAVYALLHYLYTACCPLTHTLLPHILQLANRFGLSELQQQCELYSRHPEDPGEEAWDVCPAQESSPGPQHSLAESQFLELLRSMWQHNESDGEEFGEAGGAAGEAEEEERDGADGEMKEERVDEEELEEIYEFAATQRKTELSAEMAMDSNDEEDEGVNNGFKQMQRAKGEEEANSSCHSYRLGEGGDVAAMVTSPSDMHHTQGPHAAVHLGTSTHASPEGCPEASPDRSYSHLFSQSWGEYAEPSQTSTPPPPPADQANAPGEVIDLSVSPAAEGSGEMSELSLPVAGVSPGDGEGDGAEQSTGGKPALDHQSQCHSTTTPLPPSSANSPLCRHSSSGHMRTWSKHSSKGPSVSQPEPLWLVRGSGPDVNPSGPNCNQPELIVLSDSSDDMDLDTASGKVSPHGCAFTPPSPSPLRLSQSPTQIRAKDRVEVNLSPKRTNMTDNNASVHVEGHKSDQSKGSLCGLGRESMMDGSAEVSWLIPATPEPSTRTSSTQTHCSMRPTQLFPKALSSISSSSSSAHDISKETCRSARAHSSSLRERVTSWKACPDQCSPRQCSSPGVHECSPDFQKPLSHSGVSHALRATLSDGSRGDSGKWTHSHPHSASKPCSSTPLHSDPPLQPLDSLGSPLLRGCELRPQAGSGRKGSQSSRGLRPPHLSPSRGSSSQAEGADPWEEECERSPQWKSLRHRTLRDPASAEMDRDATDMGTKEKEQLEMKDLEVRCENEVVKDAEEVSDERGTSWALDEPPIAFSDSWGLAGTVGDKATRLSLRPDSSDYECASPEHRGQSRTPSHTPSITEQGDTTPPSSEAPPNHSLPDPEVWDSWEEEEEIEDGAALPLSQRVGAVALTKRVAQLKTPVVCKKKNRAPLEPITPMPGFSDMDTPELKTRLNRYGVRPLPKKQMVLKLKEIHQYTHQLMSSESEEEADPLACSTARLHMTAPAQQPALLTFKKPTSPPTASPKKLQFGDDEQDTLPQSQDSNTSSTAESDRSNPELCRSDDDDSDSDSITASQAATRERDQLAATRSFILSDPLLYRQVLQYQPLSLASLKAALRTAGIRLGTAKLLDFLDSQCITFTTAKPGHAAPLRRRARARAPEHAGGRGRKRLAKPAE
ncbi:structure-specific endonuclease subunit SLX4 isoform X2 [Electrophorus electricus]|uniref:structure-specific endonuclease subunit SLX4 isoform X2 n=1 Tax=Electrophorus electricus TaxID=8005 RepID=UPI0015D02C14|nr:structure-specific endonuclease subunit SLX4 isoform X2 [Electrophorus electricus]